MVIAEIIIKEGMNDKTRMLIGIITAMILLTALIMPKAI
jgi:hypothetical protein